jgi:co-chaperonin GroES (HSP10)
MATAKIMQIAAAKDTNAAKAAIIAGVGDLSNVHLFSGRVLLGIYIAPEKTVGGIILTNSKVQESKWQGSVGLVLKKGKMAFVDDDINKFHGQSVEVGDWVLITSGDGKRTQINGTDCRIIEDVLIHAVLPSPDVITDVK